MSRSLRTNAVTVCTASLLLIGSLTLQAVFPVIAYAMEEAETEETMVAPTTTEEETTSEPEAVEEPVEAAAATEDNEEEENDEPETVEEEIMAAEAEGDEPELPNTPPTGDAEVTTGDATAGLEASSEVNTTEVTTDDESKTADNSAEPDPFPFLPEVEDEVVVASENAATTTTEATSTAGTGDNTAVGATATITTGDAVAYADILNVVNTNIVNSDGLISFINNTLGYTDFDLRSDFELTFADFDTAQSTNPCTGGCGSELSLYSSTNTASITNDVTVVADTGNNLAIGGDATITTGDAYASANIINVANTNISDSQYLLLIFNNFDDYAGDIVLPNSSFFDQYFSTAVGTAANTNTTNTAVIDNNVAVAADTGNNEAAGNTSSITTGNAVAEGDVTNQINQTIVGGSSFSMLIRVHGTWSGSISGLPDGLTWRETDQGIEIISANNAPGIPIGQQNVTSNNYAHINNDVQVFALTGDNEAIGGDTSITTGNAYAGASIMNIANTNVIGSNWSNLIFNIYGNWTGNLAFGQPDLWLGVTASSPDTPIMPGSLVTYTFTVFNHGDVTAPNVTLESLFERDVLGFADGTKSEPSPENTMQRWSLGDLGPGESLEFTHAARVTDRLDRNLVSAIPLSSRVQSTQRDANEADNREVVTVYVGRDRSGSDSQSSTFGANVDVTKTASRDLAQPGDTVDYSVHLFNNGGQLYDAMLVDILEDQDGNVVHEQSWPLGEIKNWENITISYSIDFDSSMATGTYTNYAQLIGFHESRKPKYQKPYESTVATHTLQLGGPEGAVLGISTDQCPAYLTEYLRFGENNNPTEVRKLQQFLNMELDRGLDESGYFDTATERAVRDFQILHRDEVLDPWGLQKDSGYVYYTTQKKINEIMCGDLAAFPLAPVQVREIETFRTEQTRYGFTNGSGQRSNTASTVAAPEVVALPAERKVAAEAASEAEPPEPPTPPEPPAVEGDDGPWNTFKTWWRSLTTRNLLSMQ